MATIELDLLEKLGEFAPDPTKVKEFVKELRDAGSATADLSQAQELLGQNR